MNDTLDEDLWSSSTKNTTDNGEKDTQGTNCQCFCRLGATVNSIICFKCVLEGGFPYKKASMLKNDKNSWKLSDFIVLIKFKFCKYYRVEPIKQLMNESM